VFSCNHWGIACFIVLDTRLLQRENECCLDIECEGYPTSLAILFRVSLSIHYVETFRIKGSDGDEICAVFYVFLND
jgi:hypothetical protein